MFCPITDESFREANQNRKRTSLSIKEEEVSYTQVSRNNFNAKGTNDIN
jgi:hypothetical protein